MSGAYYNEIDPYAVEWLRELIRQGHIADGVVDNRSISEVEPNDLREFTQCHFFAGVGVWSRALRIAGWPDNRPVWTGSCPCQPFSSAGRAGGFADERHLWPHWHHLIRECRPGVVFGEQVASKDGLAWLDLVHADLEGEDYAVGAFDLCAAGVGAPHIRQRLYFVADAIGQRFDREHSLVWGEQVDPFETDWRGEAVRNGRFLSARELAQIPYEGKFVDPARNSDGGVGHHHHQGLEGFGLRHQAESRRDGAVRSTAKAGEPCGLADTESHRQPDGAQEYGSGSPFYGTPPKIQRAGDSCPSNNPQPTGPTNGHWRAADWLLCRDGKWRPVEPSTFPLAHGAPARVGRLRAYGNAIVAQVAAELIGSYLDVKTSERTAK